MKQEELISMPERNKYIRTKGLVLKCIAETWLMVLGLIIGLCIGMVIIVNANKLGYWWIAILAVYLSMVFAAIGYMRREKELVELHALIGDELFYQIYPGRLRRELRRKEKARKRKR